MGIEEHIIDTAIYVGEVTTHDYHSGEPVELSIYKDTSTGGTFAIDSSFVVQVEPEIIHSMFNEGRFLRLVGD